MSPYRTSPVSTDQMPPGIPYIISNEAAERFFILWDENDLGRIHDQVSLAYE